MNIRDFFALKKPFCLHDHGCLYDALRYTFKNVKYGLIISTILQLIKSLKELSAGFKNFKYSFKPEYFTITVFLASTVLVLRLVKCSLRWIRDKDDGWNSFLAGMAAGWVGTKTLSKDYWYLFLMFVGSRIIGVVHKLLIENGYLEERNRHWHSFFMFFVAHSTHSIGYFMQPYLLKDDMYNLYERMSTLTLQEKKWHLTSLKYYKKHVGDLHGRMPELDAISDRKIGRLTKSIEHDHRPCSNC